MLQLRRHTASYASHGPTTCSLYFTWNLDGFFCSTQAIRRIRSLDRGIEVDWHDSKKMRILFDLELERFEDPERSSPCDWKILSNVSKSVTERDFGGGTDLSKPWKSYSRSYQLLFIEIAKVTPSIQRLRRPSMISRKKRSVKWDCRLP